jgi:hypothetical protein
MSVDDGKVALLATEAQLRLAQDIEAEKSRELKAVDRVKALKRYRARLREKVVEIALQLFGTAPNGVVEKVLTMLLEQINAETASTLHIQIIKEPLTAQNLLTIISALTELSTKYWLIVKGRYADLIEYTQTRSGLFAEEANVVITRVSYNSPFNMDWRVDLSAPSVADALITTIDGITQRQERLEQAKLENQAKAQEIKQAEQRAEQESQTTLLEQEKQRLEIERQRLEILEKQVTA